MGLFITFEGIDGCGKSTQFNLLSHYLSKKGKSVVETREPGSIGLGEKIRSILLNYDGEVSDRCESLLFLADRAQNIDVIVKPSIKRGNIVLCDRHIDSTIAYQGYGRGVDIEELDKLNNLATGGYKPDLTFVFDLPVDVALNRVGKNHDRMESSGVEFFERVRHGYIELSKKYPERIKLIDAQRSIDEVFKDVRKYVDEKNGKGNK